MNKIVFYLIKNFFGLKHKKWLNFDFGFMMVGILLSVTVLTCAMSIFDGYQKALKQLFSSITPEITIYESNLDLSGFPEIAKYSEVGYAGALLSSGDNSKSCLVQGIIPHNVPFAYSDFIKEGTGEFTAFDQIVIGKSLADELQVKLGDKISLSSSFTPKFTPMGIVYEKKLFTVIGIYSSGFSQHDQNTAFLPMENFKQVFAERDPTICTGIRLKNPHDLDKMVEKLQRKFYGVEPWDAYNKQFFNFLQFQKIMLFLVLSLLVVVASFGVINNVLVFIISRKEEIGIFRSFGLSHQAIKKFFLLKILLIAIMGIVLGQLFGYACGYILSKQTFYLLDQDVYLISSIQSSFNWHSFLLIFVISNLIIYLAINWSLRRIKNMEVKNILT